MSTETPTVDFFDLLRSMDDATTSQMHLNDEKVIRLAHGTASYLARRGVAFSLNGEPFEPGALSPHRMSRLVEDSGLHVELWPSR